MLIGKLYHVEAVARRAELDADALKQLRQDRSVQVLGEIEALLLQHLHRVLPGGLLGKALHCQGITVVEARTLRRRWQLPDRQQRLRRCEDAIRPFCGGRPYWFSSSHRHRGGHQGDNASANLYPLLQTCIANGIDGTGAAGGTAARQDRRRLRSAAAVAPHTEARLTFAAPVAHLQLPS